MVVLMVSNTKICNAQIELGVQVGLNRSKIEGDNQGDVFGAYYGPYLAKMTGLVIDIPLKPDMYISFQPGYKWSGAEMQIENSLEDIIEQLPEFDPEDLPKELLNPWIDYGELKLQYLTLPLYFKLISDNQRWQFIVGIETSILTNASLYVIKTNSTEDVKNDLNQFNYAAAVGLGYRFNLFNNRFTINMTYTQGLNNLSAGEGVDPNFDSRIKMTSSDMRLTWYVPFNKPAGFKKK